MGVWLDDGFPEHPKTAAAGEDAAWLFVSALCYCNRNLTGGRIPKPMVRRLTAHKDHDRLAKKLVDVGMWSDEGDVFEVHDYAAYQQSAEKRREEEQEKKRRASEHARKAALAKHSSQSPKPGEAKQPSLDEQGVSADRAEPEHPPGTARAPNGQSVGTGWAEPEQTVGTSGTHAGAGGRPTQDPRPVSHSRFEAPGSGVPDDAQDPSPSGLADARPEMETDDESPGQSPSEPPADPLLDRFASLWPGRVRMRAEAANVLVRARRWLDDSVIDEAIGTLIGLDSPPHKPTYLGHTLASWAVERGIYEPGHEAIADLLGATKASA